MGFDVTAVQCGHVPVQIALLLRLGLQALQSLLPDALLCPPVEAGGTSRPGAVARGNISPGSAGTQDPEDAVDDGAMVFVRVALLVGRLRWQLALLVGRLRWQLALLVGRLRWQQGFKLLPFMVG